MDPAAKEYTPFDSGVPTTDLGNFLSTNDCNALKDGTYNHIHVGPDSKASTIPTSPVHSMLIAPGYNKGVREDGGRDGVACRRMFLVLKYLSFPPHGRLPYGKR